MEELTYKEFVEKYKKTNKIWKFDQFKIVCKKCGSEKVEFNSDLECDTGLYGDFEHEGGIIVKCHGCGNAFTLDYWDIEN